MNEQQRQFLQFYEKYRRDAQSKWYRKRYETYERAHQQSVTLTSLILFLSSAVSIISVQWPRVRVWGDTYLAWPVIAAVLAATGTAVAAYRSLYGFQENARLYRDADNALAAVVADSPDECEDCYEAVVRTPAEYLPLVEAVFRREQGQWGQLVAQLRSVAPPGDNDDDDDDPDFGGADRDAAPANRGRGAPGGGGGAPGAAGGAAGGVSTTPAAGRDVGTPDPAGTPRPPATGASGAGQPVADPPKPPPPPDPGDAVG